MRRTFNDNERELLYVLADGKCQQCNATLASDFHADHKIPWSRGGETTISNGQALCPPCNLSKGATMHLNPEDYTAIASREWQQEGMKTVFDRVKDGKNQHLCVGCPASGKTRFAIAAARALFDAGVINYVIVVGPKDIIRSNWATNFKERAELNVHAVTSKNLRQQQINNALSFDGIATTYQSNLKGYGGISTICQHKKVLVILDEIHWARQSYANRQAFGTALDDAFHDATQILSLSGTPWRSDRARIPFVEYDMNTGIAKAHVTYDYAEAIRRQTCRPMVFRRTDGYIEFEDARSGTVSGRLSDETEATRMPNGEYTCDSGTVGKKYLRAVTDPGINIGINIIEQAHARLVDVRQTHPEAGGLIVCRGRDEAEKYAEQMHKSLGVRPIIVHSGTGTGRTDIEGFAASTSMWIIAVDMVTEGTDIPRLRVGVNLHTTMTLMHFRQLVGRFARWEDHVEGDQSSFIFIPHYGPLHLMALDVETEIAPAMEEAEVKKICTTCGESPCVCPCETCGLPKDECECPGPPPQYFKAILSQFEEASGSTAGGTDFSEAEQSMVDDLVNNPEVSQHTQRDMLIYAKLSKDRSVSRAHFYWMDDETFQQFWNDMSAATGRQHEDAEAETV